MENLLYAVAVLGSLCNDSTASPNILAVVMRKLHELNQKLLILAPPDCQRCDGDWLPEEEALFEQAGKEVERLASIGLKVELYYNDQVPAEARSRLRLEIPRTPWDSAAPLYLS